MSRAVARFAFVAALSAACLPATAQVDPGMGWANARLSESLSSDRAEFTYTWRETVITRSVRWSEPVTGARTWDAWQQNPWANAYGTPSTATPPLPRPYARGTAWQATTVRPKAYAGPIRLCSCYLPSTARSWDGGPLTDADVARMCRAQCE